MGSVLWRQDYLAEAAGTNQDTFYTYDPLQQVKNYERGTLRFSGGTPPVDSESFDYDPMGNWLNYQTPLTTLPLDQDRGYNRSNQITSITNPSGVIQPVYNPQGDMTLTPSPSDWGTGYDLKWDPWHRLVEVKKHGTTTVIASYTYDAAHRRMTATTTPAGSTTPVTRVSYYDTRWRAVEEWVGTAIQCQYLWDPYDRWNLIRRLRSTGGGSLNEIWWALRDNLLCSTSPNHWEMAGLQGFREPCRKLPKFRYRLHARRDRFASEMRTIFLPACE